jgi:hypothetical protein
MVAALLALFLAEQELRTAKRLIAPQPQEMSHFPSYQTELD